MSNLLANKLIDWYERHYRDLPWRQTKNPYHIWLSEIILQQTRVQQGLPYYERFIEAYPRLEDLAAAPEQEVLRRWQGLGYYSRARNLHACAKKIVAEYNGLFPDTYEALQKLPGVGKYTAAAIASFAFGKVVPVVDGNVYRVLARLFGEFTDIAHPKAFKVFFDIASQHIDGTRPDIFNQAMMEFGALQCTPQKPLCLYCPLQQQCWAFAHSQQDALPVKSKKAAPKARYLHYIVVETSGGRLLMGPRPAGDIWQGLYDFYLLQAHELQRPEDLEDPFLKELLLLQPRYEPSASYRHQLTHQRLHVVFFKFGIGEESLKKLALPPNLSLYLPSQIEALPKPVLIQNYLKESGI